MTTDTRLGAYLAAPDDRARERELEALLANEVVPGVRRVLALYARTEWALQAVDAEDVIAQVTLKIVRKLRAMTADDEQSVQNLEAYVVTLSRNVIRDLIRRNAPARSQLQNRLRYLFTHSPQFAAWTHDETTVCGLAGRIGSAPADVDLNRLALPGTVYDSRDPESAALALFDAVNAPVRLSALVTFFMRAWRIEEQPQSPLAPEHVSVAAEFDTREYLASLWREILGLPARQRAALLLNLRDPSAGNAILLFVALRIATVDQLAHALEMTPESLAALWERLPLDDLAIAEQFGLTRQQVINLRKAARQRLGRRMSAKFSNWRPA